MQRTRDFFTSRLGYNCPLRAFFSCAIATAKARWVYTRVARVCTRTPEPIGRWDALQEVSGYLDLAQRFKEDDFDDYFGKKKKLMPKPSDLR